VIGSKASYPVQYAVQISSSKEIWKPI
jgi:hypothetical protein